jgi:hypothetical protein
MSLRIIDLPSITGQTTDTSLPVSLSSSTATTYRMTLNQVAGVINGRGAQVNMVGSDFSVPNYTSGETTIVWNNLLFQDVNTIWTAGNPSGARLYVPAGVTRVSLSVVLNWQDVSTGARQVKIKSSNAENWASNVIPADPTFPSNYVSSTSGIIDLPAAGYATDGTTYFYCVACQDSGNAINIRGVQSSNFSMTIYR